MPVIETEQDVIDNAGEHGKWKLWSLELEAAKEFRKSWIDEANEYYKIYKNETKEAEFCDDRYPIMWANIQTLKPLVYSNLPLADIRKRYTNKDAIARLSGILLEKSVNYFLESAAADKKLKKTRDDGLITGLGELKVRFEADIVKLGDNEGEEGDESEEIADKRIELDFFSYDDVLCGIATDEDALPWKAYRHKPTRQELVDMFGDKGKEVSLTQSMLDKKKLEDDNAEAEEVFKRAEVWEIWDKRSHKVIFWSQGYNKGLLSEKDDKYNLREFYPSPPSLNMGRINGSILPAPPYRMYKPQAEELNRVTDRIENIIEQMKVGGLINKALDSEDAESFLMPDVDGEYKPTKNIDPNVDINKLIYERDLRKLAEVLTVLRIHKQELIEEIRDITGISDVVRGTSNAVETATAQKLKGNFAISRMSTQQEEMTRFIRDLIRIVGEIIAENWSGEELAKIAGMTIIDQKELAIKFAKLVGERDLNGPEVQQIQKVMQEELERGIKLNNAVTNQMLEQVEALLTDDQLRSYAIDIESETTAQLDNDKTKAQRIEFMNIMTTFIKTNIPMVQAGLLPMDAFKAMVSFVASPFKVGRELEEAFEMLGEQSEEQKAAKQQPSKEMIDAMNDKRKLDIEETKVKGDLELGAKKLELEEGKAVIDMNEKENDREAEFTIKKLAETAKLPKDAQEQLQ
jgi:hypothetical protein